MLQNKTSRLSRVFGPAISCRLRSSYCVQRRHYSIQRQKDWESVIGLEVHAQINTESKLFSGAGADFGATVNSQVALFDCAIPGTLPILNKKCVEASVLTALALECRLNRVSTFDRKHYFYADLPAGYQITQQREPIAQNGVCHFLVYNPDVHKTPYYAKTKIRQLQLEQDSGRSIHDEEGQRSLIDLNRAGAPLMEIVFDPDLKDGEEAAALVKELSLILQKLGTCTAKMDEGALRVDANISVNRTGEAMGTRTEVKNLNSVRGLANAIEFEVKRQIHILETGGVIINETRGYDARIKETVPMRDKEVKQDYRFMPEPNLPPIHLIYDPQAKPSGNQVNIATVQKGLTELPDNCRKYLVKTYDLRLESAIVIVNTHGLFEYFKSVMKHFDSTKGVSVANRLQIEFLEALNKRDLSFANSPVTEAVFAQLCALYEEGKINLPKLSALIEILMDGDKRDPEKIVEEEGWSMITDMSLITNLCRKVIEENPKLVAKYLRNPDKPRHFQRLMNILIEQEGDKFHMKSVAERLRKLLDEKKLQS